MSNTNTPAPLGCTSTPEPQTHAHTPGPWKAHGCSVYTADDWRDGINHGNQPIVLFADRHPDAEALANARLIAAAPELLAAATAALRNECLPQHERNLDVVQQLRAAIAAAGGAA